MAKKTKAAKKPTAKSIRDRVIEQRKVRAEELLANPANWRKHPDQQRAAFRGLLNEIGFAGAALAYYSERAGGALTLIDGHLRREELGPRFELACTITDLTDAEADKLLAAYDPVGALAETDRATFDELLKRAAWDDADVNAMLTLVVAEADAVEQQDSPYTREVSAPIYVPHGPKPRIAELCDTTRADALIKAIDESTLPEAEKTFLRLAAMRHVVFNYERIAEWYAHSNAASQRLMEQSALVVIDFKQAIELGYVTLSKALASIYGEEYGAS